MSNGQQIAEENYRKFMAWRAEKTPQDLRQLESRGVLSRVDIAKECGFAKSALAQNPRIKAALLQLEEELRLQGVLPPLAPTSTDVPAVRERRREPTGRETERMRRLEQDNAALRKENEELKRQLEKYCVLQLALAQTGRIPR